VVLFVVLVAESGRKQFICEEAFNQCIAATVGNRSGQDKCKSDVKTKCGTLNAQDAATGGSTTTSSSGATAPTQTGPSNSSPSSSATPKNAAAPTEVPRYAGMALAAAVLGVYAI
jgi:hypothetical protein